MKTILITGATSGIGEETARVFASQGHRLILCGRRAEKLESLKKELEEETKVYTLCFDVREKESVEKAIDSLSGEWREIDVLVNNAGNAYGLEPLSEGDLTDWDKMIDSNVKGLLYVSSPVIRMMKERGKGQVVNLSSVAARQTYAGGVVYCASKKAVDVISEGMRMELTPFGIKVTNIQPGAVKTDFSMIRFKGDQQRADKVYQGYEPLVAKDIADAIFYCVNLPERVTIAELCIMPKAQSEARTIYRK